MYDYKIIKHEPLHISIVLYIIIILSPVSENIRQGKKNMPVSGNEASPKIR